MSKVLVVYWSGTGNTQMMAEAIAEGAKDAGAEVTLTEFSGIDVDKAAALDYIAFGCPSMGDEVLEEGEVEIFFGDIEGKLGGKKVALFGSYDWGDGKWMRDWCERTQAAGAKLYDHEGLIVNLTPDDASLESCRKTGAGLAAMQ